MLVGETTFGKGSVQNVVQLPDGSALRFTTAKYYTPSKQVIHGNGVAPNIRVPMTAEQERALFTSRNDNLKPDEEKNLIKTKDPQLLRAIDALKGVMIYAQETSPKTRPGEEVAPQSKGLSSSGGRAVSRVLYSLPFVRQGGAWHTGEMPVLRCASMPTILAIETSCDETAVAILRGDELLASEVASQTEHEAYGGVVPEVASRNHLLHAPRSLKARSRKPASR